MSANGYVLSPKSKNYHALDSFVYEYVNAGGSRDNLKIEINYMLRCHVLPVVRRKVELPWNKEELTTLSVAPLLNRTAPRDLYDMHNLVQYGLFDEEEQIMLRKCVVYYSAVGTETPPEKFDLSNIGKVSAQKIKTDLIPVLRRGERFALDIVQKEVSQYLSDILIPTEDEIGFWNEFRNGNYRPELIFEDTEQCISIKEHPVALWKCQKNKGVSSFETD